MARGLLVANILALAICMQAGTAPSGDCTLPKNWLNVSNCHMSSDCLFNCQDCGSGPCSCDMTLCPTSELQLKEGQLECVARTGRCTKQPEVKTARRRLGGEYYEEGTPEVEEDGEAYQPASQNIEEAEEEEGNDSEGEGEKEGYEAEGEGGGKESEYPEVKDYYQKKERFCPCNRWHCLMKNGYDATGRKSAEYDLKRNARKLGEDGSVYNEEEEEEGKPNPYIGSAFCVPKIYRPKPKYKYPYNYGYSPPVNYMPASQPGAYNQPLASDGYSSAAQEYSYRRKLPFSRKVDNDEGKHPDDYVCPQHSVQCPEEEEKEEEEYTIFTLGKKINVVLW